jgi:hypothetical protein
MGGGKIAEDFPVIENFPQGGLQRHHNRRDGVAGFLARLFDVLIPCERVAHPAFARNFSRKGLPRDAQF